MQEYGELLTKMRHDKNITSSTKNSTMSNTIMRTTLVNYLGFQSTQIITRMMSIYTSQEGELEGGGRNGGPSFIGECGGKYGNGFDGR